MGHLQTGGMQQMSAHLSLRLPISFSSVNMIPDDGVSGVGGMDPNLVCATCSNFNLDQAGQVARLKNAKAGKGRFSGGEHGHFLTVDAMTSDRSVPFSSGSGRMAVEIGEIPFFNFAGFELFHQALMGGICFGHKQDPTGFFIKAMNNSGPCDATDSREVTGAMVEKSMDESTGIVTGRGMNHDSGGFVQSQKVFILKKDIELVTLRDEGHGDDGGKANLDFLTYCKLVLGLNGLAIETDVALLDEVLNTSSTQAKGPGEDLVQSRSDIFLTDDIRFTF